MAVQTKIQFRRDTAANWTTANPVLGGGEVGFETDTTKFKIGDGTTVWASLNYYVSSASPTFTGTVTLPTDTVTSGMILNNTIVDGDISTTANIAHSKLVNATDGQILLGTTTTGVITATSITGDISITGAGVATITPLSVVDGDIANTTITLAKLVSGISGQIVLANGTGVPAYTTVSGDITIGATGVTAIGSLKVTNGMLTGSIADTKLLTIATSGKVSNSATTATAVNTNSAIVARDASGNFAANLITGNACKAGGTFWQATNSTNTVLFRADVATAVFSKTVTSGRTVQVDSSGTLGSTTSTRRNKENIVPYVDPENKILSVSPVTFDYKLGVVDAESDRFNKFGMVAEDLHDVGLNHLVYYGPDGTIDGIDYMMLSVELLGVVRNLESRIKELEK